MPKIGKRIIKSSIAVFLCLMIDYIRITVFKGAGGLPFYSAIAAILAMQTDAIHSKQVSWTRIIGTFIGGFIGIIVLFIERNYIPETMPIIQNALIAVAIIPVIYITVLLDKKAAAYISCVVFMSVAIVHGEDVNPTLFTLNRILDTLIGISVSLGVNLFHLPRKANKEALYVTNLDGTLMNSSGVISLISKIKLNRMIECGASIALATSRNLSTIIPIVSGINLKLPIITMNGAALYDIEKEMYMNCKPIKKECTRQIIDLMDKHNLNCFVNSVIRDTLHIYYSDFTNIVEEEIYNTMHKTAHGNYVYSKFNDIYDALSIMIVNKDEIIIKMYNEIRSIECYTFLNVIHYKDLLHQGYSYLEIYDRNVSKETAVLELKEKLNKTIVAAYGNDINDVSMMQVADYKYAMENSVDIVKDCGCEIIGSNDKDSVAKSMEKSFFQYKF
ncbi:MAG: putative hydrolase, family [Clostridiales bacterium]|jgi:Cof subfamily protein (haloacid dehalogenase superfamily)|nr:putative hydrolase, family [Clostridiales bacterium]